MTEHKSPFDQLVDLLVYAPVGAAMTAQEKLPELIGKGHDRLAGRVATAKLFGQFAVTQGRKEADRLAKQAGGLLCGLGQRPERSASTAPGPAAGPSPSTSPPQRGTSSVVPPTATTPAATGAPPVVPTTNGSAATGPIGAAATVRPGRATPRTQDPASADLAIPGYDSLSASQVVQRLAGLSPTELEAVRTYEATNRGRRTILSRIAQLQNEQRSQ